MQYEKNIISEQYILRAYSKIYVKKEFHTVYFCCFKCFEEHNVWPKKRSDGKKVIKKNGKKGGRNGSKERNSKK